MSIPNRRMWVALKKQHGIADGAVSGVSLGPLIEKVTKATTPATETVALKEFMTAAGKYIGKIDKKKVKDYPKFEKVFLDEYLDEARKSLKNYELAGDKKELMASELRRFFAAAQAFKPAGATSADVKAFVHRGRGVSSAILRAPGIADYTKMKKILTAFDGLGAKLGSPQAVQASATEALKLAKALAAEAQAQNLIDKLKPQ